MKETPPLPALSGFKDERDYRRSLASNLPYKVLCDFGNAFKHRTLTQGAPVLTGISSVKQRYAVCKFSDAQGEYFRTLKAVTLEDSAGVQHEGRRLIVPSMRFWAQELFRMGVIPQMDARLFELDEFVARSDQSYLGPLTFMGMAGEPLEFHPLSLDYSETERALVLAPAGTQYVDKAEFAFEIQESRFSP
ncbi:MAG: hypothetical protein IV094_11830 [Vitreoscilla sp.]|nr:hypothetical protein [Vitreoscilla sp.]